MKRVLAKLRFARLRKKLDYSKDASWEGWLRGITGDDEKWLLTNYPKEICREYLRVIENSDKRPWPCFAEQFVKYGDSATGARALELTWEYLSSEIGRLDQETWGMRWVTVATLNLIFEHLIPPPAYIDRLITCFEANFDHLPHNENPYRDPDLIVYKDDLKNESESTIMEIIVQLAEKARNSNQALEDAYVAHGLTPQAVEWEIRKRIHRYLHVISAANMPDEQLLQTGLIGLYLGRSYYLHKHIDKLIYPQQVELVRFLVHLNKLKKQIESEEVEYYSPLNCILFGVEIPELTEVICKKENAYHFDVGKTYKIARCYSGGRTVNIFHNKGRSSEPHSGYPSYLFSVKQNTVRIGE